jgi:hypothetical protein
MQSAMTSPIGIHRKGRKDRKERQTKGKAADIPTEGKASFSPHWLRRFPLRPLRPLRLVFFLTPAS